jgi:hypothetical protein
LRGPNPKAPGSAGGYLLNLISMENIDLYSTHLELLNKISEIKGKFNNIIEFGMGNYSTPFLIDNSENCISIEMQSDEWFNTINLKFKDLNSWTGIKSIGPFGFYSLDYPEKITLVQNRIFGKIRCLIAFE